MIRQDFPIFKKRSGSKSLVYFDNAASLQKPQAVISAVTSFYQNSYANIHRALYPLAEEATNLYENARQVVASFISADSEEIIFTKGATESINLVARSWGESNLRRGDRVVISWAEHHANIVPWLQLKEKIGIRLEYIDLRSDGSIDMKSALVKLSLPRVKLMSVTQVSNVLGIINPVDKLISLAKSKQIITLVDASQSIGHFPIDVKKLACDFLVFSGHKLGGPTGIGVLYGRKNILDKLPPFLGGGDMIESVRYNGYTPAQVPRKFEAGTPPISGAIGLAAACKYINHIGWKKISKIEKELTEKFFEGLVSHSYIRLLGNNKDKLPIFSLIIDNVHPHDAADWLGQEGIALRAGFHCAQPLHKYYNISATLRASLSFYNSKSEIDYFFKKIAALHKYFTK